MEPEKIDDNDPMPRPLRSTLMRGMITARHAQWLVPSVCIAVVAALYLATPDRSEATRSPPAPVTRQTLPDGTVTLPLSLPPPAVPASVSAPAPAAQAADTAAQPADAGGGAAAWRTVTVHRGQSLATVFAHQGLSAADLQEVMHAGGEARTLRRLYPGDTLKLLVDSHGELQALHYDLDAARTLRVRRSGAVFVADVLQRQIEVRVARASGVLDSSFYQAGKDAGLSDRLIMALADVFGWDIDFALDIRPGDSFTVLYDQDYVDGEKVDDGDIVAAEFVNQGHSFRAVRYTTPQGHTDYYSPDGHSMRKAFLRTPVVFTRISSYFNLHRLHPILHHIRPHKGVDYAAPMGTPVRATGDGKVVWRGRHGGYGNVIMLQHGPRYQTLYAHLSRFARSVHKGGYVKQGQVIGYVGMTGLATGPHLHYEFHVDGVYRNPLTVKLPQAAPIAARYRADFMVKTRPLIAELSTLDKTTVASTGE